MLAKTQRNEDSLTVLVGMQRVHPLRTTVWQVLKKLDVHLPQDPVVLLITLESENHVRPKTWTLFTIAKSWKEPEALQWVNDQLWHSYMME